MRMLSSTTRRSRTLIDRDRLQLYQGWDKRNPTNLFNGLKRTSETFEKSKIVLALEDMIHHQSSLIGRDTCVVLACSSACPDQDLVVKISWPSTHRDSEKKLMAVAKMKATGIGSWNIFPRSFILKTSLSTINIRRRRLVELLNKAEYADGKPFIYDEHVLRITVSERLFPATDLTDIKDIVQVFFDIFRCHHWLYKNPKILHCDMSLNNMMYRKRHDNSERRFKVFGVLNDFDLSCSIPLKEATSLQRIVHHLTWPINFWISPMLSTCISAEGKVMKELSKDEKDLPFEKWYDRTMSWETLAAVKLSFFAGREPISPSKSFSAFLPWLNTIRCLFRKGLPVLADSESDLSQTDLPSHLKLLGTVQPSVPFDNETLGGYIISTEISEIISRLDGHPPVIDNNQ
ncbi:hypothetical protein EDD18DRAFT_1466525 [Armillaria luteobubalina]|uniref:Fungal-type protein kinase domain-containing protein n=1 Tax=Armillaria luteobubalina TaxID=153913 RepID=A0AA39PQR2_9AGAR|nr:hypothetical protein EDD18DRAFT_1466525 [Armillaria luteobubalina]